MNWVHLQPNECSMDAVVATLQEAERLLRGVDEQLQLKALPGTASVQAHALAGAKEAARALDLFREWEKK